MKFTIHPPLWLMRFLFPEFTKRLERQAEWKGNTRQAVFEGIVVEAKKPQSKD